MTGTGFHPPIGGDARPTHAAFTHLAVDDDGYLLEMPPGTPMFRLPGVGAYLWRCFDGRTDLDTIVGDLADVRGTDRADELASGIEFVRTLIEEGLVTVDREPTSPESLSSADPARHPREVFPDAFDFSMAAYPMSADPHGRPSSRDLLLATFPEDGPLRTAITALADALIAELGPNRTVWGMKVDAGRVIWELYFYLHRRPESETPPIYFERARAAIAQQVGWNAPLRIPENTKIVSFELEFDGGELRPPELINLYHSINGGVEMMLAYDYDHTGCRLKNTYELFLVPGLLDELARRLESSRYLFPENVGVASDHWLGELRSVQTCQSVQVSYKPRSDGIYLSRVTLHDLVDFLERYDYPAHLTEWVGARRDQLDHLRYDLGFDYTLRDGTVEVNKTGFYGYF